MSASGTTSRGTFDRHPVATGLTIAVVLLLLLDLVAGSVVRIAAQHAVLRRYEHERVYRIASARYHHDLAPMVRDDSALWGPVPYRMRTNSLGFRDDTTRVAGAPGQAGTVLFIGDSFTEGVGVDFDSTFVGRIAARVRPRGLAVLNAGVSSYAPSVYWRKVVDVIARRRVPVSEVVVFIDPYDMVDETNYWFDADTNVHMHQEFGSLQPETTNPADPLTVRARVWWRLHSLVVFRGVRAVSRLASDPCRTPGAVDDIRCKEGWKPLSVLMTEYGARGLPLARSHMSSLAAFLRDRHIPLTVVIYPWRIQLDEHDPATRYTSAWRDWGAAEHVPVIDLFPSFFAGAGRLGLRGMTDSMTISGDEHWNAAGHGFVAGAFLGLYCQGRLGAPAATPLAAVACPTPVR